MKPLLLWLLLFPLAASATDTLNTRLHQHALLAPRTTNVRQLVAYLTQAAPTKRERVEVIFYWIAEHIAYDYQLENQANIPVMDVSPDTVLRRQKTICSGYAQLFATMAAYAGVECRTITGTAENRFSGGMHAWNAVYIDRRWLLVDVTWGSGGTLRNSDHFIKRLDLRYLFPEPAFLLTTHFPTHSRWQLLDAPISLGTFRGMLWKQKREALYQDEVFRASTSHTAQLYKKNLR